MTELFSVHSIIALGALLLLWAIFAWAEYRRYGRGKRLLLRTVLLFAALAALFGAYVKPAYRVSSTSVTIVLNGHAPQKLDSLLAAYPAAKVLSLQPHEKYPLLEGLSYLKNYATPGSQVLVVGSALTPQALEYLKDFAFIYIPEQKVEGLLALNYDRLFSINDSLVAQGRWSAGKANEKLLLATARLGLDSAVASKAGPHRFSLAAPLFFAGSQVYHLYHLNRQGDTLASYRIPVQVPAQSPYQMGLLTAYPAAESKYLKEYLSVKGYALHYMAQLAPGKNIQEWINLPQKELQFNQKAMAQWDVFLLSTGYYNTMGSSQHEILQKSISREGIGLLLIPETEQNSISWQGSRITFQPAEVQDTFLISGVRVPVTYRPIQRVPENWQVQLRGSKGVAAVSRRHGLGQVMVSGVSDSYTLLLKGQEAAYRHLWNSLLNEVLPLLAKQVSWEDIPIAAMEHMPVQLGLYSQDSLPEIQLLGPNLQVLEVPYWQDQDKPHYWQLQFWPRQSGWHTAVAAGDTARFWVSDNLPSLLEASMQDKLRQAAAGRSNNANLDSNRVYQQQAVPDWLFYMLFLTSMGGLWLEKKING